MGQQELIQLKWDPTSSKSALEEATFKPGAEESGGIQQGKGLGKGEKTAETKGPSKP